MIIEEEITVAMAFQNDSLLIGILLKFPQCKVFASLQIRNKIFADIPVKAPLQIRTVIRRRVKVPCLYNTILYLYLIPQSQR
ncbi:MAG: hypothetical protein LUE23_10125, partial [Lachnospiraceae bacterium]|nr:hypothetical protein [Lachnospiraceae bacterium]